jgi:hypothetical protein
MEIISEKTVIEIVNESLFSPQSADIVHRYSSEVDLTEGGDLPSSRHGVIIDGEPIVVFLAGGGASCVQDHSALSMDGFLYLAVGDHVVSFGIAAKRVRKDR